MGPYYLKIETTNILMIEKVKKWKIYSIQQYNILNKFKIYFPLENKKCNRPTFP